VNEDNVEFALTSESDAPAVPAAKGGSRKSGAHEAAVGNDAELLVAMRGGRSRALRGFYVRFRPVLLDQAYRLGVQSGEREETVTEFLGDIALKLIKSASMPQALAAYVITAFRHAVISRYRQEGRHALHYADAANDVAQTNELAVTTVCSEYTLRAVRGDRGVDGYEMHPVAAQLAARLLAGMSESDRELLTWLGERVPGTTIAAWRETTHNAVKVKISRLRARLRAEAGLYMTEVDGEARDELERFFRRAGVTVTPPPVVKTVTHEPSAHPCRLSPIDDVTMNAGYFSPYGPEDV